jgi:hypothetical protein
LLSVPAVLMLAPFSWMEPVAFSVVATSEPAVPVPVMLKSAVCGAVPFWM